MVRRERRREFDRFRRVSKPWRALYDTAAWKRIRLHQLTAEPLCRWCRDRGLTVVATVCDHVVAHRGDPDKFFAGPFQSLCKPCHDRDAQRRDHEA
jgi:5-methylcytosine-specific restriction protein A